MSCKLEEQVIIPKVNVFLCRHLSGQALHDPAGGGRGAGEPVTISDPCANKSNSGQIRHSVIHRSDGGGQ